MTDENLPIGQRIQAAREAADLTQPMVARMLGVSTQTVYRWEAGANIKPRDLAALERALGLPLNALGSGAVDFNGTPMVGRVRVHKKVSRGTPDDTDDHGSERQSDGSIIHLERGTTIPAAIAKRVKEFEREAARMGASDQELDLMIEALTNGSARAFYLGSSGQQEELEHLIEAQRAWLGARIKRRKRAERHSS